MLQAIRKQRASACEHEHAMANASLNPCPSLELT